ncbi:hypothetical protein NM688_g4838 [Phlebia brevispora]|uniref:Uncharacterized protein n=1 Tax=Phlebia brevispora TaxID=194682 RepID=A0ACC1T2C9_9APHY|nr:hypothetical protein NM688_g4838 [Phlebia brevispora]
MPSSTSSHPCLPKDLLDKLKGEPAYSFSNSLIFSSTFEQLRLQALDLSDGGSGILLETEFTQPTLVDEAMFGGLAASNLLGHLMCNTMHFRRGDQKTALHWAICNADVPLTYEMIRIGINIDHKDSEGVTPLFLALESIFTQNRLTESAADLVHLRRFPPSIQAIMVSEGKPENVANKIKCLTHIITLLIEQHADVNVSAFGCTPLNLAAELGQWEVAKLLLVHGATPIDPESLRLSPPSNKARLSSIQCEVCPADPRPAQPCPCWSGKLLSQCHDAAKIRYPDHFLCRCGARKVYAACCAKRGLVLRERWNREERRLRATQDTTCYNFGIHAEVPQVYEVRWARWKTILDETADEGIEGTEWRDKWLAYLRFTKRDEDIDPAFMYAFTSNSNFIPRPWGIGCISKIEAKRCMDTWNADVDKYVLDGHDPRSALDIEIEAKIATHGGPLHRRCEADGCTKVEGRDIEKLKCCSKCKLVFYCSKSCQLKSWKAHKEDCAEKKHRAQVLSSQLTMEQALAAMVESSGWNCDSLHWFGLLATADLYQGGTRHSTAATDTPFLDTLYLYLTPNFQQSYPLTTPMSTIPSSGSRFLLIFHDQHVRFMESESEGDAGVVYKRIGFASKMLVKIPARKVLRSTTVYEAIPNIWKDAMLKAVAPEGVQYLVVAYDYTVMKQQGANDSSSAEALYNEISEDLPKVLIEVPTVEVLKKYGPQPWLTMCENEMKKRITGIALSEDSPVLSTVFSLFQ